MKSKHIPMRKCIGCNTSKPQNELIRLAFVDGDIVFDVERKAVGRGVYVCKDMACLKKIFKKKGFMRAFGVDVTDEQKDALLEEIKSYEEDK